MVRHPLPYLLLVIAGDAVNQCARLCVLSRGRACLVSHSRADPLNSPHPWLLCVLGLQAPLEQQVEQLVGEGRFEEAINICAIFQNDQHHTALLASIDRASLPPSLTHAH
jgi:hypothetical protein